MIADVSLPERVISDIQRVAKEYNAGKIVLFGSRARGTNRPKSDIDLAVYDCADFARFALALEDEVWTLLKFDLVDMKNAVSELALEIEREGRLIYEKI